MKRSVILAAYFLTGTVAASAAGPKMPTFSARRDYTGLHSQEVQVADTNGDGIPDLIVSESGYIEVLFGNGNGTFRPGPATTTGMSYVGSFIATDISGDGTVDLVMAGEVEQGPVAQWGIGICLGRGDGTFRPVVLYQAGTDFGISFLVVGDFNGDGIPDVAAAGASGIWLFTGKGGGAFNPGVLAVQLATESGALAAADFNGNGKLGLVVTMPFGTSGSGSGFAVLLGNGNGTFQPPQTFAEPQRAVGLAVGPLTKGGYPGIALADGSDAYLYFGNGAGGFKGPEVVDLPTATGIGGIAIGDVNGDGIPDLVSSYGYIAFGTGRGTFTKPAYYPIQSSDGTYNVVLADLRNNGLTDIVTDSQFGVSVLLSQGKGRYEDGEWTKVTGGAGCGARADYNDDGKPDLAVNNAQGVSVLLGTGNAKSPFTTGATIALANAGCLVTGDLNGDGIPDLLVPANGTVVVYLGNGDGTFTLKSTTATPSGGYLALVDFNHDGKLDFATSGNLLALGNGDGTFQTPTAFVSSPPSGGFSNIAVGDINNDGWPDVVLTNLDVPYSNLYVLLNNQHGGFTQVPTSFGELTSQAILADLNGDGNLDLVLQFDSGSGVYFGDGTGAFTPGPGIPGPIAGGGINMVADLNGDGIPDIAVETSGTMAIYIGIGDGTYETPFDIGTGPSPGDILVENLHGQSPSRGLPDIVAPDTSGGVMVLINLTK
ncbi:MAG: VCBS repeat-containing protein [Bryobacteraceae bacterium]|jgi:hypothetical protein